jgi:hypothetical protein
MSEASRMFADVVPHTSRLSPYSTVFRRERFWHRYCTVKG